MTNSIVDQPERAAHNQALFRDVNERLEQLNRTASKLAPSGDWICECSDTACFEQIEMSLAEYREIRQSSVRFAVAPDEAHVDRAAERVVERNDRYWVVEKSARAARIAAALDRRVAD